MAAAGRSGLPTTPARRLVRPVVKFLHIESASGVVLLLATAAALAIANSSYAHDFHDFWHLKATVGIGSFTLSESLGHWVNDGLMTIFFFVVGLEIKRELVSGELNEIRKAVIPAIAALGGMIVPALIYFALQNGSPGARGWGIPMATDIAFVVGIMALFGRRVPVGLKVLLLSLAIVDDIGAILVIAVAYSAGIKVAVLACGFAGFVLIYAMNRLGVRTVPLYLLVGAGIWLAFLKSGVHPTVAGVGLGLMTPSAAWIGPEELMGVLNRVTGMEGVADTNRTEALLDAAEASTESIAPLDRLIDRLHPWVSFIIMPVFALANAGVAINPDAVVHPVSFAVAAGLLFGKPLGVFLFTFAAVKFGVGKLPTGVTWPLLVAGGYLAGIGFTMSLFISALALPVELLDAGKVGTLIGSVISAVFGAGVLLFVSRKGPAA
jgi:Na+:H+ antiporter, NhaA family